MPTREENVVQIEAALRQRFFPHVPKVETTSRVGWTEEQHDTDRLSRSLAAYALVNHCDIDDLTAVGAITDGSDTPTAKAAGFLFHPAVPPSAVL